MARGALRVADGRFAHVLVVAPDGTEARWTRSAWSCCGRRTPIPTRGASRPRGERWRSCGSADFVVALVSGGASSLVCLPQGMEPRAVLKAVRALLLGGATVREVNVVRRHLCAVKGGGLARAAGGPVRTLVASDVIGGAAYDVGSGPTVADPTTRGDARAVLARYAPASQRRRCTSR